MTRIPTIIVTNKRRIKQINSKASGVTFNQNQLFETGINRPKLVPNNIYPLSAKQK